MRGTLRKRSQFQLVYEKGTKLVGRLCVVYAYRPEASDTHRVGEDAVGVVASKKVGNAVARARAKRRLREAYRPLHSRIRRPQWIVLIARHPLSAKKLQCERVVEEMERLLHEMDLLVPSRADTHGEVRPC